MAANKAIDKICIIVTVITVIAAILFCNAQAFGVEAAYRLVGYENRLFDNTKVHTIDLVMDDWDSFIETCENEEYAVCSAVIDGEAYRNIAIRAKGNTSLSSVKSMDSSRYSFKLEFDHFDSTKTYHGLDKLCLNNIIQDNTYMKDYLAYTLMKEYGADTPLCSYAYITVNNEDWGLYLAVEGVEDSFLQRNYGSDYGELYKPDSLSFGGGRGNGKDFDMQEFIAENSSEEESAEGSETSSGTAGEKSGGSSFPQGGGMPDMSQFGGSMPDMSQFGGSMPEGMSMPEGFDPASASGSSSDKSGRGGFGNFGGFGGFGGMGSSDVKLQYIDDDPDSYSNIFDSAKTDITTADKNRLISTLKTLSEGEDKSEAVNIDEVIRYFAVHVFLCNGDSYTGMMVHNYYLYEDDGKLSMIPWDYNLAYGSFQGSNAASTVNSPIDTPVSGGMSDRPMLAWIFESEEYTQKYHEILSELVNNTDFAELVSRTAAMISEYVEKDPTKFCTYEEFEKGVAAISQFCTLRAESVKGQLAGTIPSTSDGQNADSSSFVDASGLTISDMGSMGGDKDKGEGGGGFGGFGGFGGKSRPDRAERSEKSKSTESSAEGSANEQTDAVSADMSVSFDANAPSGFGGNTPDGFDPSSFGGNMPEGFDPSSFGGNTPEGFDPSSFGGTSPAPAGSTETKPAESAETTPAENTNTTPAENADTKPADSVGNEQSTSPQPGASPFGQSGQNDSRPSFGGSTRSTQTADNTSGLILLGASALVLILGLAFAALFKRR